MAAIALPDTPASAALWRERLPSCYAGQVTDELVRTVDALSTTLRRAVLGRLEGAVRCGVVDPETLDCIVEVVVASQQAVAESPSDGAS